MLEFDGRRICGVTLVPLDLGFECGADRRGIPCWADPATGHRIISAAARRSRRYGASIVYDEASNTGQLKMSATA